MAGLALPRRLKVSIASQELCKRIGVRFNGEDMGQSVASYDTGKNEIILTDGTKRVGLVEPYWRDQIS